MRIAVATTFVPLIEGGGEKLASELVSTLRDHGHEVELIRIPFMSDPAFMVEQMLAVRLMDVSDQGELMICLRTPSYLLRHPNKVIWFLHHHRGAYDLWGTPLQDIQPGPHAEQIRASFIASDNLAFAESRKIFGISRTVCERIESHNGFAARPLYPPLLDPSQFRCGPSGDYVFFPSRIAGNKRQQLAIESMLHVRSGVRLVLAGAHDTEGQRVELEQLIERHGLGDRVELITRFISESEKVELLAGALAALYPPFKEDYGYVTLESFHSSKPVITCSDSGGPTELVQDGVNGLIAEPSPAALAAAIDRLAGDREAAAAMGRAAAGRPAELRISWDAVVEALVS
jgi:glycosyltransferase involved in cell wall biosynthesis